MGTETGALDFEHHGPVDLARANIEAQAHVCQRYLGSAFESVVVVFNARDDVHAIYSLFCIARRQDQQ
ncbi:hypothetical protein [Shinella sumterensis]|uniref:hypothetical protein n=1 Tax=Shinella sumterensis TaxID=1967501 RepID=UPI00106DF322|nr:hypothetical protein [Shinella sumterensis]MCD1264286.1 hypothetical protein [Shinella sumterensis]